MKHRTMAVLTVLAVFGGGLLCYVSKQAAAVNAVAVSRTAILLDPGHGGADGGASGTDGTAEKAVNLAISLPLRDLLRLMGCRVTMTRETDTALSDTAVHGWKAADMNRRLALYEQADLTVSVHQNYFTQSRYDGTQVFYGTAQPESRTLAESIRRAVVTALQPDNTRELKAADSGIYLLHRTTRPAVLVECGFLSNEAERDKLKDSIYQKQMALAIAVGVLSSGV